MDKLTTATKRTLKRNGSFKIEKENPSLAGLSTGIYCSFDGSDSYGDFAY